jgi:hypothetical protein
LAEYFERYSNILIPTSPLSLLLLLTMDINDNFSSLRQDEFETKSEEEEEEENNLCTQQ